jgi:hypothetical protein
MERDVYAIAIYFSRAAPDPFAVFSQFSDVGVSFGFDLRLRLVGGDGADILFGRRGDRQRGLEAR